MVAMMTRRRVLLAHARKALAGKVTRYFDERSPKPTVNQGNLSVDETAYEDVA